MIKYRVEFMFGTTIEKKEIDRETEKSVFWTTKSGFKERSLKITPYHRWFDTWEEAHYLALTRAKTTMDSLRSQLETAEGRLKNIKNMDKP